MFRDLHMLVATCAKHSKKTKKQTKKQTNKKNKNKNKNKQKQKTKTKKATMVSGTSFRVLRLLSV